MLWLLRECFRVFTFRTFFRFWGPPKKGDTFEIEDGFVPVIGRHSPKETHQATPEHQAYGAFRNSIAGDNQSNVNNDNNSAVEQSPKRPFRPTILVESTSTQNICTEKTAISESDQRRNSSLSTSELENGNVQRSTARLRVSVFYAAEDKMLTVTINEVAQILDQTACERGASLQIRLAFLSTEGRVQKEITKFVGTSTSLTPTFAQSFDFPANSEDLAASVIRFRLYVKPRQKKNAVCTGESFLRCCSIETDSVRPINHFLALKAPDEHERSMSLVEEGGKSKISSAIPSLLSAFNIGNNNKGSTLGNSPTSSRNSLNTLGGPLLSSSSPSRRSSTVDESGRFCSLPQSDGTAEILLSLCYFIDQAKLVVGVQKASGLNIANKLLDTYVKITAASQSGIEVGKSKSEIVKGTTEPIYNMQAVFQISRNDLEMSSVQVELFTYQGILRRKVSLGFVSLGEEKCSSPDAQIHWQEMIDGMGITVDKWHKLEPSNK